MLTRGLARGLIAGFRALLAAVGGFGIVGVLIVVLIVVIIIYFVRRG